MRSLAWTALAITLAACSSAVPAELPACDPERPCSYRVIHRYPHDPQAFTQGLAYEGGYLYEGTGLRGESTLRKVELEIGQVIQSVALDPIYFGEGIALVDDRIVQLTFTSGLGFVYDSHSFARLGEFEYAGEGWGLALANDRLILSDGTATLRVLDPQSFAVVDRIEVTDRGSPVERLNELEYVNGELFANVWQTDRIARISLTTGQLLGWIDLEGLLGADRIDPGVDVLNGIAYDSEGRRLFVTGKRWPWLFEIELVP